MSYGRMRQEEARLAAIVREMLQRAEETDAAEDAEYGSDVSGDELPAELRHAENRLRRIREAKAALEAEARARAEASRAAREQGPPRRGRPPKPPREAPRDTDQYNFTDPDSRIMKDGQGAFVQAYNAQVAVDRRHQIIVAGDVTAQAADAPQLKPMVQAIRDETGGRPRRLTADAGYYSAANIDWLHTEHMEALIPPDKVKHTHAIPPAPRGRIPKGRSARERMRRTLQTKAGRAVYRMHKAIAEPVIGQIKSAACFTHFLLRGLPKVRCEWKLILTAHNIRKLFAAGSKVQSVLAT